jgi:hypothetical protein
VAISSGVVIAWHNKSLDPAAPRGSAGSLVVMKNDVNGPGDTDPFASRCCSGSVRGTVGFVVCCQTPGGLALTDKQIRASLAAANKQIIAPMRQAWINALRDLLAELTSRALHYHVAGFEERTDEEYGRLTLLEHKIAMMLNPLEGDHKELEQLIRQLISALSAGREAEAKFPDLHRAVMDVSRQIFKREWNRVRDNIELA